MRFPVVPAYSELARTYDLVLGRESLARTRPTFESLVRRYGIRFRSAADIGCGTGLFARYLAERWDVPVFAADRSREMLSVALENCRHPRVRLLEQDIRCLKLPQAVDLVTANFDVVNHLPEIADLRRAFHRVGANLAPGGHFIFDAITNCRPLGGRSVFARRSRGASHDLIQQVHWDPRTRRLTGFVVHLQSGRAGGPWVERHVERGYTPAEVGRALLDTGFVVRGVHDAVTLCPARECAPRIVVVAQRRASTRSC